MIKMRKKMVKKKDRKVFTRTADMTHKKNMQAAPMRGGYRL